MQLCLRIEFVTYDGWCEDEDGSSDDISESDENTFVECNEKCYRNEECTAFSYETPTHSEYRNCHLSLGGPYTTGSGRLNTKCYEPKPGTSFYIYINEYMYMDNTTKIHY